MEKQKLLNHLQEDLHKNSFQKNIKIKKSLRYKILFVVFPFFIISFGFFGITTYFSTNKSITNVAKEFIGYYLKELVEFSQEQMGQVPVDNMINNLAINNSILSYAQKFNEENFLIIPYNYAEITANLTNYTWSTNITQEDFDELYKLVKEQKNILETDPEAYNSWIRIPMDNDMIFVGLFIPNTGMQSWFLLLISEDKFYAPVKETMIYLIIIAIISLIVLSVLILVFVNFITKPLTYCVETIKMITDNMDFSKRIKISYPDEIGILGQYFNDMIQELEKSYNQIKNYAYQTVVAKQKEERIRFIFQKYVPSDVIDHVLNKATDTMLIGNKQKVTMLFSDIRDFTTISESLSPEELVLSLNVYFTEMVGQIINNKGIIDKFIGDSIMALFGSTVVSETAADDAVRSALMMIEALKQFNIKQKAQNKITFEVGIGINTGEVIVGNIGSEQKVEYTVIGDAVNLGSRLEGLTKSYKVPLLISEFTKEETKNPQEYFYINIDTVRVKGKKLPVVIYSPKLRSLLSQEEIAFYSQYHNAQQYYYQGAFNKAYELFVQLRNSMYIPYLIKLYLERCTYLIQNPPTNWDGVETWKTK